MQSKALHSIAMHCRALSRALHYYFRLFFNDMNWKPSVDEVAVKAAIEESVSRHGALISVRIKAIDFQRAIAFARYSWAGDLDYNREGDNVLVWGWTEKTPIDNNEFQIRFFGE